MHCDVYTALESQVEHVLQNELCVVAEYVPLGHVVQLMAPARLNEPG